MKINIAASSSSERAAEENGFTSDIGTNCSATKLQCSGITISTNLQCRRLIHSTIDWIIYKYC